LVLGRVMRWGLKQSCSPRWELFNDMLHDTCTQGNRGDLWLLVVRNQSANLTLDPSFGHNLCFRCPNGSCEPTLDIYISVVFQWYKECKLCQNNLNANLINIVMMPSTYCINYQISIESSTYSHQFDGLLIYVLLMLVIFFSLD